MLRQSAARFAVRRTQPLRAGGATDAPTWSIKSGEYVKYSFQPSIPDKHFYGGHYNYAPITLWLRARRPAMEHIISSVYATVTGTAMSIASPVVSVTEANLPGVGCKLMGLVGVCLGLQWCVGKGNEWTSARMVLEKLQSYAYAVQLDKEGFWNSQSQDLNARAQDYNVDRLRLEALWDEAMTSATQDNSFQTLCSYLEKDLHASPPSYPITWRFNMMPYGATSGDVTPFPVAAGEVPGAPFMLMDVGSHGDYIDRQDNKPNPIRKARHLYAGAYMPPTK
jgi:hypothetical protein